MKNFQTDEEINHTLLNGMNHQTLMDHNNIVLESSDEIRGDNLNDLIMCDYSHISSHEASYAEAKPIVTKPTECLNINTMGKT